MDNNTIRIFSFPGGSTKGYGSNRFMQKFLQQWGVPQEDFWEYADVFCGTSIGAILACAYSMGKTSDELEPFFLEKAKRIFTTRTAAELATGSHNANTDSNRPNKAQKIALIALNDPFYASPYEDSNYGHNILHQELINTFGSNKLSDLKNYICIPAVERDMSRPVIFSNFNDPYFIGQNESIVNVCRASSSAYPYLPAYNFNGHDYIDGAFLCNDPISHAINIGYTIKPYATRIIITVVGTGIGREGFDGSEPLSGSDYAVSEVFASLTSTMTYAEENIRRELEYKASRLQNFHYYKFQPQFPSDFNNETDNSSSEWFNGLANIIDAKYTADSDKISTHIARLGA